MLVAVLHEDSVRRLLSLADGVARELAEPQGVEEAEPEAEGHAVSDRVEARERVAV